MTTNNGPKNTFSNYKKMIALADKHWKESDHKKISSLNVTIEGINTLKINMIERSTISVQHPI